MGKSVDKSPGDLEIGPDPSCSVLDMHMMSAYPGFDVVYLQIVYIIVQWIYSILYKMYSSYKYLHGC